MFERELLLIGEDNLNIIKNSTVLVLGLGGVGGYTVESLTRAGIGTLILIDFDTVDITNLNRQIIGLISNIGFKKVDCFEKRIKDINKDCNVIKYDMFYNDEDYIFDNKIDYVIDCCDSSNSKKNIIEKCLERNIKIISSMGTGNRLDPSKFMITKLKNTSYDPLAKKMRFLLKENRDALNIPVLISSEIPKKIENKIGSISFVPPTAGLLIASYVINDIIKTK